MPMQVLARTCVETLWRQRLDYSAVELSAALEASLELLGQCTGAPPPKYASRCAARWSSALRRCGWVRTAAGLATLHRAIQVAFRHR
jgi:hypothetical protein